MKNSLSKNIFLLITTLTIIILTYGCKSYNESDYKNAVTINRDDNVLQIILPMKRLLLVRLQEKAQKGEIWELERFDSNILKLLKNDYDPLTKEQLFYFAPLDIGSCELVFRNQKIWQQDKEDISNTNLNKLFFRIITKNRR